MENEYTFFPLKLIPKIVKIYTISLRKHRIKKLMHFFINNFGAKKIETKFILVSESDILKLLCR